MENIERDSPIADAGTVTESASSITARECPGPVTGSGSSHADTVDWLSPARTAMLNSTEAKRDAAEINRDSPAADVASYDDAGSHTDNNDARSENVGVGRPSPQSAECDRISSKQAGGPRVIGYPTTTNGDAAE